MGNLKEEMGYRARTSSADELPLLSPSDKPERNLSLSDDYSMEALNLDTDLNHRTGYVAVLGKPNVRKSTLSNQMIGQKISVVADKPQTTMH